ncbi:Ycf66 family protein [uncultured Thermosynechococcus sp.]|uniref:Ycf66 family protein n=1 Tax=uncultured Thermosynechococcus sp. TaxID=436945 RepID=UPI002636E627|nr:Ycf66 family protein [uncultured Thermosynechococcus sp.]
MLTNLLAWSMAIASLGLYLLGFFLPELYRRFDLIASGAGLFFALTLWIYGDRLGGGLLLGTTAAVALILWFGWQTLSYRWQLTYPGDRTDTQKAQALWQKVRSLLPAGALAKIGEQLQGLIAPLRDRLQKQPDRPPLPVDTPPPPMDTGNIKEDLWTGETATSGTAAQQSTPSPGSEQAAEPEPTPTPLEETTTGATAATPTDTPTNLPPAGVTETPTSPPVTAPEEPSVEAPQPPTASTPEEPEPATATASEDPVASSQEQAPPETVAVTLPETAVDAPEPTVTPESHTSAAGLLGNIPESSDSEDEATPEGSTIENPEHPAPEDDDWPPREARL